MIEDSMIEDSMIYFVEDNNSEICMLFLGELIILSMN